MSIISYVNRPAPLALDPAIQLLGNEPEGLALDFAAMRGYIRDRSVEANNFLGDPNGLLTYADPSPKWIFNKAGQLESGITLRCEYDPVSRQALGVKVEGQRTNYILKSNDNSIAALSGVTTGPYENRDGVVYPNLKIIESATDSQHFKANSAEALVGTEMSFSTALKYTGRSDISFFGSGNNPIQGGATVRIKTDTGEVLAGKAVVQDFGDDWRRYSTQYLPSVTGSVNIYTSFINGSSIYPGDGVSGIAAAFNQVEYGKFPSSIILTDGSAVTRAADVITLDKAGTPEGTVIIEARTAAGDNGSQVAWCWDDGSNNNRIVVYRTSSKHVVASLSVGGSVVSSVDMGTVESNTPIKVAASWKSGQVSATLNGGDGVSNVFAGSPPAVSKFRVGSLVLGSEWFGHIRDLVILPRAVSAVELKAASALS